MNLNDSNYNYYLAYQKIALEINLLFLTQQHIGLAVMQKLSEFFFRDFIFDQNNVYFPFNFLLEAIDFLIEKIDKDNYEDI